MGKLIKAIQSADVPEITIELYSREIISENTRDKVLLTNQTKAEKITILLSAVEDAITAQILETFLDIHNPADIIAQDMRKQLCKLWSNSSYCLQLLIILATRHYNHNMYT